MMAGVISPTVRTGTLEGVLCSMETIGVLLVGMGQSSPKGWGTKVISLGNLGMLKCTNMGCAVGDCGWGSFVDVLETF